jgi:hypothetical protein
MVVKIQPLRTRPRRTTIESDAIDAVLISTLGAFDENIHVDSPS